MKNSNYRKGLFMLSLLVISSTLLGNNENKDTNYEDWKRNIIREGTRRSGERIELGSYSNVIKTLNEEYLKKHGKLLIKINEETLKSSNSIKIPVVTNISYLFSNPNKYGGTDGEFLYSEKGKITWEKLKKEGLKALTDEQKSKIRKLENLYSRRVYFANGTRLNNFKILSPKDYKQTLKNLEDKNEILVASNGRYENIGNRISGFPEEAIKIGSMKEYYKNIVSASPNERLKYLQKKIKSQLNKTSYKDVDIVIENNKLYTFDKKTKEKWLVDMTFSPYIVPTKSKYFGDDEIVASRIRVFFPSTEVKTGENDAVIYSKDGSLYIEDANFPGESLRIVKGQIDSVKNGEKLSQVDENPNKQYEPDTKDTSLTRLRLETMGKKIQLNGKGRIDGDIDLGLGENRILLEPPISGEFGTSIILGPYVNIKNVNTIEVGALKNPHKKIKYESFGERQPLTLDIDPKIINVRGEYDQNAFKTREDKLRVFDDTLLLRDQKVAPFNIELMVSKLSKDGIININLPSEYKVSSRYGGNELNVKINYDSDSLAHLIVDQKEIRDNGKVKTNVYVKIKDSIDGLDSNENDVYRSIKYSGKIGELSDTLSYVNKQTFFADTKKIEVFNELKLLIDQTSKKNIYSHLNNISKNQIDTFKNIEFSSLDRNINLGKTYVNGGYISNRDVADDFKGNTNIGYGIYEKKLSEKLTIGGILGGGTSNHQEIKSDTLNTVTTESKVKGQSIYVGTYINYLLNKKLSISNGIGVQHGQYKTNRNLKNNYQNFNYNSKSDIDNLNVYSGLLYNYPLPNDLNLNLKGLLSYTLLNQKSISEENGTLAIDVNQKYYNYINSEIGVGLSKTLYRKDIKSVLSGTIYGVYDIYSTENSLTGKIKNSSALFQINGKEYNSESVKLVLNYDVEKNSGVIYGIKGEYMTNSNINTIGIGIKAGYIF